MNFFYHFLHTISTTKTSCKIEVSLKMNEKSSFDLSYHIILKITKLKEDCRY